MAKQLRFKGESLASLRGGVDQLTDAVRVTLGPKGRNVVIEAKYGAPSVINDGNAIAKEIELADPFANLGAKLIQQVAAKTKEKAGDGTTTATVLAAALVGEGLRNVGAGASPVLLRRGMEKGVAVLVDRIARRARPLSEEGIRQVASVSAGGDEPVGAIIAEAFARVTVNGVITVDESQSLDTELDVTEGMEIDRGYISPYFITNQQSQTCEYEDCLVLITDKKISSASDLIPVLEIVNQAKKPLLVVAEDVEGEALATLVMNKSRGVLSAVAIKAPSFGENRKAMLDDLALVTGARLIDTSDLSMNLEDVGLADLGRIRKLTVSKSATTVVAPDDVNAAGLQARVAQLRRQLNDVDSDYDAEQLEKRIAKLTGGVALIKVGAATETDLKNRKARIQDAVNATRAAMEEGVVDGGGATLALLAGELDGLLESLEGDERTGVQALASALSAPLAQMARNGGYDGGVVVSEVVAKGLGFNVATGVYEDLHAAGIIDPAKVVRLALQDAASVAGMLITTDAVVADIPEPTPPPAPGGGDPMGGMGGMGMGGMGGMGMGGMGGGMGMPGMM